MSSRAPRPSWTVVPTDESPVETVLEWLARRFPRVPAEVWRDRFARGLVIDESRRSLVPETLCRPGLRIGYYREVDDEPAAPEPTIIHVDDHLVVVDKPHFLPVTPAGRWVRNCVLYEVEDRLGIEDLAPIHRLDRQTAGLVLLGRRSEERGVYGGLFARAEVQRRYRAVGRLRGSVDRTSWTVESRVGPGDPFFRMRDDGNGPPNAVTEVELLTDHREAGATSGWGTFGLRPRTGKKHQLRLHMARIGSPIAGDRLYPDLLAERPDAESAPLALVATGLDFDDPITGERRAFRSRSAPAVPAPELAPPSP